MYKIRRRKEKRVEGLPGSRTRRSIIHGIIRDPKVSTATEHPFLSKVSVMLAAAFPFAAISSLQASSTCTAVAQIPTAFHYLVALPSPLHSSCPPSSGELPLRLLVLSVQLVPQLVRALPKPVERRARVRYPKVQEGILSFMYASMLPYKLIGLVDTDVARL